MFKKLTLLTLTAFGVLTLASGCKKSEEPMNEDKQVAVAIDPAMMDGKISATDDFFMHVNGIWLGKNPIPADKERWGAFSILADENLKSLKDIFEDLAAGKHKNGSTEQQVGDFYFSSMDTEKIEAAGAAPLKPYLDRIDRIATKQDLVKEIGFQHTLTNNPVFSMGGEQDSKNSGMIVTHLYQGGLGLPDRDYYLEPSMAPLKAKYEEHITKMFVLLGQEQSAAAKSAKAAVELETQLAANSFTRHELRDPNKNYNKMDLAGLQKLSPKIDWAAYFGAAQNPNTNEIVVGQPKFFTAISGMVDKVPMENWKAYLKWNALNGCATLLSSKFDQQNFDFYGKTLSGTQEQQPRWKRMVGLTSQALGEAVGKMYVKEFFPPAAKERMVKLVDNLKVTLGEHIQALDWMSEVTKKEAGEKLKRIEVKIGYPDKWIDYSSVKITRNSLFDNTVATAIFSYKKNIEEIGKPVDRSKWHMTPQTVNAYYNPLSNEIVFPAAILQPPFFNLNADDAVNYGGIGAVIGHELTHGFDDQGRQYDKDGNLRDWWTPEDAEKFKQKAQVLVDQYNGFTVLDSMHVDGALTLGENIADLGGVTIAYNAFLKTLKGKKAEKLDGFTPQQRFFINYAQVWRTNIRPEEQMKRLRTDVHSPAYWRVNGVVQNLPIFYEQFGVKEGDKTYLPEEKRAKIW